MAKKVLNIEDRIDNIDSNIVVTEDSADTYSIESLGTITVTSGSFTHIEATEGLSETHVFIDNANVSHSLFIQNGVIISSSLG